MKIYMSFGRSWIAPGPSDLKLSIADIDIYEKINFLRKFTIEAVAVDYR